MDISLQQLTSVCDTIVRQLQNAQQQPPTTSGSSSMVYTSAFVPIHPSPHKVANTSAVTQYTHTTTIMDALMHATPSQNSSTIPMQPPKFNGYTDVKSWLDAMEVVFLSKHVSSDQEKMIWVRTAPQPGIAVEFFESIQGIPSWENFEEMWTKRFTPYNRQFKFRQRWRETRMKGEDIDRYISDFKTAVYFVPGVHDEEALFHFQV